MSADIVAELLADLIDPARYACTAPTPAKAANSASPEQACGLAADLGVCKELRIAANVELQALAAEPDSQEVAAVRSTSDAPQSEQWCGFSQNSQDSQGVVTSKGTQSCAGCLRRLPRGTCGAPVAAGLRTKDQGFGIVWPPERHGQSCRAFTPKMPVVASDRPYRLTRDESARCHAPCWDDPEIEAFTARAQRFARLGRIAAEDLAERLMLRDREGDDRRLCLECSWLGDTGRCLAAAAGRLPGADRRLEPVQTILQRCEAFGLRKGLV